MPWNCIGNEQSMNKPRVFFAIPCGEFFSTQEKIITQISSKVAIDAVIVERDLVTKGLWEKIVEKIDDADYFVADVSSGSPNVLLELGYALRDKPERRIGIFISSSAKTLSDLSGFVRQEYSSLSDFADKLSGWLSDSIPNISEDLVGSNGIYLKSYFHEEFMNQDLFLKRWAVPPTGQYIFKGKGIQIGNMNFPMLTKHLGLMDDHEFEFKAQILKKCIGWAVRGTYQNYDDLIPSFCLMFNLNPEARITAHIWNAHKPDPVNLYHILRSEEIRAFSVDDWITVRTVIKGDSVTIFLNDLEIMNIDFAMPGFHEAYILDYKKQSQVGFRVDRGEEAIINYVTVNGPA